MKFYFVFFFVGQATINRFLVEKLSIQEEYATSDGIRRGLQAQKYSRIQSKPDGVKRLINEFYEEVKAIDKKFISTLIKTNVKFSAIFDEWKAGNRKKYINLILSYRETSSGNSKLINLGLCRISSKSSAVNLLAIVEEKLNEFNINYCKDIVSIVTDGCNTMLLVGKLSLPVMQQLC